MIVRGSLEPPDGDEPEDDETPYTEPEGDEPPSGVPDLSGFVLQWAKAMDPTVTRMANLWAIQFAEATQPIWENLASTLREISFAPLAKSLSEVALSQNVIDQLLENQRAFLSPLLDYQLQIKLADFVTEIIADLPEDATSEDLTEALEESDDRLPHEVFELTNLDKAGAAAWIASVAVALFVILAITHPAIAAAVITSGQFLPWAKTLAFKSYQAMRPSKED